MLTDRGKLLLVAALTLWGLARMFGVPQLSMAAVASLALVGLAVAYTRALSAPLAVRRRVRPVRLFHDTEAAVTLEVSNRGRLPTATLVVVDTAPAELADPHPVAVPLLRPGEAIQLSYRVHGRRRGRWRLGPAQVWLRDPFGVAQRPVRFAHTDEVVVYPPMWPLPDVLPHRGRRATTGSSTSRPLAQSDEFATVRDYIRGDDLRTVHWKTTAHRGKLMVKQGHVARQPQATLVLDTRGHVHRGTGPGSTFERAVAVTASAARHLSENGYQLRLIDEPAEVLDPAGGVPGRSDSRSSPDLPRSAAWQPLVERLADSRPRPAARVGAVWHQRANGAVGEGLLVVVTPASAELAGLFDAGRGFAGRVAVLVATPGRRPGDDRDTDQAVRALRGAGWRAAVHQPGDRLADAWRALSLQAPSVPTAAAEVPEPVSRAGRPSRADPAHDKPRR